MTETRIQSPKLQIVPLCFFIQTKTCQSTTYYFCILMTEFKHDLLGPNFESLDLIITLIGVFALILYLMLIAGQTYNCVCIFNKLNSFVIINIVTYYVVTIL